MLPDHFAADLERLQRFEREAKSLADRVTLNAVGVNVARTLGASLPEPGDTGSNAPQNRRW